MLYDLNLALDAFSKVLRHHPNALLILTGSPKFLKLRSSNILPMGFLPKEEYGRVLGACDLCLLPLSDHLANRARFPGKFGDYMAAGRPVVSNDVGDVGRLIREHNVGVVTKPTPDDYAQGIVDALKQPGSLSVWGSNARKLAEGNLSFDILSQDLAHIYTLLAESSARHPCL